MNTSTQSATLLLLAMFLLCGVVWLVESECRDHAIAEEIRRWRKLPFAARLLSVLLLALATVYAGTKADPEDVVTPPLEQESDFTESPQEENAPLMGEGQPRLTTNQYAAGFALLTRTCTNAAPWLAVPSNAVTHAPWTRYGLAEDTFWIPATNWAFILGTNAAEGAHVSSSGTISFNPNTPKGSQRAAEMPDGDTLSFLAPLQASLGTVPPEGRFWHAVTASNSVLMTWQDLYAGRDTNSPVTFQAELFASGDFVYRYAFTNALALTNFVIGAQHGGGGETYALSDMARLANGLELRWRAFGMLDPGVDDHDGDGLSTYDEVMAHGTDPSMPDTDLDGLSDPGELEAGTDPLSRDRDGDGIPDGGDPHPLAADTDDFDGDGFPDAWETHWFGGTNVTGSAAADTNGDGVSDLVNMLSGSNPSFAACAVTTSYGAHTFMWTDLPGATNYAAAVSAGGATIWACVTNVCSLTVTGNFTSAEHTLSVTAYGCATPLTASVAFRQPSQPNLTVWKIADPFALQIPQGCTSAVGRTFNILRSNGWQQYFVSSGYGSAGAWELEGLRLDWQDSGGGSGTAAASPAWDSLRLGLSTNSPQSLSVRIVPTVSSGLARSPKPLYLIAWSPAVTLSSTCAVSVATTNGPVLVAVSDRGGGASPVTFAVDRNGRPCNAPASAGETFSQSLPFGPGTAGVISGTYGACGELTGGAVNAVGPGLFSLPVKTGTASGGGGGANQPHPPGDPDPEPGAVCLISPVITCTGGNRDCGCLQNGSDGYPFDSACLRRAAENSGICAEQPPGFSVSLGSAEADALFIVRINGEIMSSYEWVSSGSPAAVTVSFEGAQVWNTEVSPSSGIQPHLCLDSWAKGGDCGGGCGGCEGGDCSATEGDGFGSVRFRLPLGVTGFRETAGFVWFSLESQQSVTPALFQVSGDAGVIAEYANPGDTLSRAARSGPGGRDVRIEIVTGGVRVSVRDTGDASEDRSWTVTETAGGVRFVKKDGSGNTLRDVSYSRGDSGWGRADNLTGAFEDRPRTGNVTNGIESAYAWISVGAQLIAGTYTERTLIGAGPAAAARETMHAEWDSETGRWVGIRMSYWTNSLNELLNGCPRFKQADGGDWEYRAYDDGGRETLRATPLDGSGHPPFAAEREPFSLSPSGSYPAFTGVVAVTSYTPAQDDGNAMEDTAKPRQISRYAVRGGTPALISREWHAYTRNTNGVWQTVTQRVVRAASQASAASDPANAVTVTVGYPDDDQAIPALLRGRPLREEKENGTLLTWEYALDANTLAVTSRSGTAALPYGVANESVFEVETLDAVFGRTLARETRLYTGSGSGTLLKSETRTYDAEGRLLSAAYSDGTSVSNVWGCCQKDAEIGRDGRRTEFWAIPTQPWWSATAETSLGSLPGASGRYPVTESATDALGRETNSVRSVWFNGSRDSACATLVTRTEYPYGTDGCRATTDPLGVQTLIRRIYGDGCVTDETVSPGVTNRTTRYPGGAAVTEKFWRDPVSGASLSLRTRTQSSWDAGGCETETVSVSNNNGPWMTQSLTVRDFLGREVTRSRAGYGGATLVTSNAYDSAGRTLMTVGHDGSRTVYAYDALGNGAGTVRIGAGQQLSFDPQSFTLANVIALDEYAVTETPAWKEDPNDLGLSGYGVPSVRWDCNATVIHNPGQDAVTTSVQRVQLTGLSAACVRRSVTTDINGAVTVTTESLDAGNARIAVTSVNTATAAAETSVTVAGVQVSGTNSFGGATSYTFDGFARQVTAAETAGSRTLQRATGYHDDGTVAFSAEIGGTVSNVTTYSERQYLQEPAGAYSVTATDALGNQTVSYYSGDGAPYRSGGAVYPTATARDADGRQSELRTWRDETGDPDITRWHYDTSSGLVTNKVYADGKGPAYSYRADGRLASRTWARDAVTAYGYADTTDGSAMTVTYNDGTPAVSNSYTLAGQLVQVNDGTGSRTLSYNAKGQLTAETNSLAVIKRRYDALGRDTGYDLELPDFGGGSFQVSYGYGSDGRLDRVTSALNGVTNTFSYSHVEGTSLIAGMTNSARLGWSRSNEPNRNLITAVSNWWNGATVSAFRYENDALGRRTLRVDASQSLSATNVFAYNQRSEVTNAAMNAVTYNYDYDDIGNRQTSSVNAVPSTYTANSLNQYTAITGGQARSLEYDPDGNMTLNGDWAYDWDGENNLRFAQQTVQTNGSLSVENGYDYLKRRWYKRVDVLTGYEPPSGNPPMPGEPGEYMPSKTTYFVWDGWNIAAEVNIDEIAGTTNITRYVWGLDLSGSIKGAGGVGGLLAVIEGDGSVYFPCYDANGNITEYVDANGAVVAHREFDAFGNTTAATGTLVHQLHFWFSTKYLDEETANYVYQQRQAVPSLGRWASRDPIGEKGGINLFCMILSDLINRTDYLGLLLNLKDLPNTCGKCKVYWVERSGERGLTAQPAQWLTGTMNYTPCGGGTGRNDPPRFKRSYTGESCVTRIYTDVDPQSPSGIKGVTYAQHEMKHVKCGADAYEWMLKELASKVLGSCCCMSAWSENGDVLERLIRLAAEDMRQACTYKVDADDYPNSTNKEERENAPTKQMHSDGALKRLQEKIAEIERRAKKWATCQ